MWAVGTLVSAWPVVQDKNMVSVFRSVFGVAIDCVFCWCCREIVRGGVMMSSLVVTVMMLLRGYFAASRLELFSMPVAFFSGGSPLDSIQIW